MILRNSKSVGKKACVLLALAGARNLRGLQYLCFARGCIHARLPARSRFGKGRWAKNFLTQTLLLT